MTEPRPSEPQAAAPATPRETGRLLWEAVRAWLLPARSPAVLVAVAVVAAAAAGAAVFLLRPGAGAGTPPELVLPRAQPGTVTTTVSPAVSGGGPGGGAPGAPAGAPPGTPPGGLATVHAAGKVAHPGIYVLPAGSRVADAITAAGGPLPDADIDGLNLAAKLADGDRVYVPRKGEAPPPQPGVSGAGGGGGSGSTVQSGPVDLNTADEKQLDSLPGVGPATAKAIITYRTEHGRFRSVDELLDVPGIGPAKLEKLRPAVKV